MITCHIKAKNNLDELLELCIKAKNANLDELLEPVDNVEEAVLVKVSDVSCSHPAVLKQVLQGAWKCNFPPFKEFMTDRPTNQPTNIETGWVIEKLYFH